MLSHPSIRSLTQRLRSVEACALALLAVLCAGMIFNWRWMRGNDEWRWNRYPLPGIEERVWLSALVCAAVAGLALWIVNRRPTRPGPRATLLLLIVAGLAVQLGLLYLEHPQPVVTLFYRTVSPTSGGFFNVAGRIADIQDTLRRYPELMPGFPELHPQTHPPGLPLLFWGATQLLAGLPAAADGIGMALRLPVCSELTLMPLSNAALGSSLVQMSTPVWGALAVAPLYALARRLYGEDTARRGAILLILAPSLVLWVTRWNQVYVLFTAMCLYFTDRGLAGRRSWPFAIAGVIFSIATFLSPTNLAIGFLLAAYAGLFWISRALTPDRSASPPPGISIGEIARQIFGFAVGAASVWVAYGLAYGVTFFDIYRSGIATHTGLNRTYSLWVVYDLFDFFLFLGIPALLALALTLRSSLSRPSLSRIVQPQHVPFWAFGITLVALDLSGTVRGEVARIWMFLLPAAVPAGLPAVARWSRRRMSLMIGVQVVQLLVLGYFLRTVGTGFPYYEPRQASAQAASPATPISAQLGQHGEIALLGYDVAGADPKPGEALPVTLYWRAERRLQHPYTVFVHLVDDAGQVRAQHDGMPQNGSLPTTCWLAGEVVADTHSLPLDAALAPGRYVLQAGMYRLDLLQAGDPNHRLPVEWNGQADDRITLTPIDITPP